MKQLGSKPEGCLDELIRKAVDDPMLDDIIEASKPELRLNMKPSQMAKDIVSGIENHIGFKPMSYVDSGKLVRDRYDVEDVVFYTTYNNSLLAIAYLGLNEYEKMSSIFRGIEQLKLHQFPDDSWLHYSHNEELGGVKDNAALAILYYLTNAKNISQQYLKGIESYLQDNIWKLGDKRIVARNDDIDVDGSYMLAIAHYLCGNHKQAESLESGLDTFVNVSNYGMYGADILVGPEQNNGGWHRISATASYAIFQMFKEKQVNQKLFEAMENAIGYNRFPNGDVLFRDSCKVVVKSGKPQFQRFPAHLTHNNALVAIAYNMREYLK